MRKTKSWIKFSETEIFNTWRARHRKIRRRFLKGYICNGHSPTISFREALARRGCISLSKSDMIARSARMRGFEVLFPIGIDRNGLQSSSILKKNTTLAKATPRRKNFSNFAKSLSTTWNRKWSRLQANGTIREYDQKYRTDDVSYRSFTHRHSSRSGRWRVYREQDPATTVLIARHDSRRRDCLIRNFPRNLFSSNFKIKGSPPGEAIPIASTRPELICTCEAVIVNPETAVQITGGKSATIPIYKREVPILVIIPRKPEFGIRQLYGVLLRRL